ncbi:MAG TPA: Gfo/Idh/MocA family oxidoreductase [Planctomycetota bacterium]|nr:Gfo/Idh/MocA family oxidoreductase [Planctomycetota bacterium]
MTTRREFLRTATAAAATAAMPIPLVHAAGSDVLRVGLIGCGGRGTGAAEQALKADPNVKLVAMGDAFENRIKSSLANLRQAVGEKVDVKEDQCFVGFDAYKHVIAASDVVLLCEPPHFRPSHLKAAIEAGKHVFAEKPVAVDGPGVRSVLATCEEARKKGLSIVSGLCLRYSAGFREMMKRLHDGAIGDLVALQANDYRGGRWARSREDGWSDMTWHMRNWYNFTWLSGDFNVEQHVHYLDVCAWAMKDQYPVKAVGMGGRSVLTGPEYGNIYDHFSIVYEYANGTKLFSNTRQHPKCKGDMSAWAMGSKGRALISEGPLTISGENAWEHKGKDKNMYQVEHDEFFASIRSGKPINNGEYMSKSSLLAIMGRMAAYTGQQITWEQALNSKEDLTPAKYEWDLAIATPPVAIPGVTKFF